MLPIEPGSAEHRLEFAAAQDGKGSLTVEGGVFGDEEGELHPRIVVGEGRESLLETWEDAFGAELPDGIGEAAAPALDSEEPPGALSFVDCLARDAEKLSDLAGAERALSG